MAMDIVKVIGQQDIKDRLERLVTEEKVPHALLFCGPEGVGKMALAMYFACYLLTKGKPTDQFSMFGESDYSRDEAMLRKWEHPDLHFTYPTIKTPSMGSEHQPISADFAKEWNELIQNGAYFTLQSWMNCMKATTQQAIITGAESDELAKRLSLKSSQGGYKVSIIWRPERMNLTSANKFLKLLEEPPSKTVFILVSEEPEALLETIKSRTQRIDIKRIDGDSLEKALTYQRGLDTDTAHRIARIANGNWLKALEVLDADNENKEFLLLFQQLMRLCYARNVRELKTWSEAVAALGREKQRRMLNYFMQQVRENFMFNFRNAELNYMTLEEEQFADRKSVV